MDGDALSQIEPVYNLGGLLELKSCLKSRWQPWLGGSLYKFIWIRQPCYIGTHSLVSPFLNYFVHGNHWKTIAGPECSSVYNYGCILVHPCSIGATMWGELHFLLVASEFGSRCWLSPLKSFMAQEQNIWDTIYLQLFLPTLKSQTGLAYFRSCLLNSGISPDSGHVTSMRLSLPGGTAHLLLRRFG